MGFRRGARITRLISTREFLEECKFSVELLKMGKIQKKRKRLISTRENAFFAKARAEARFRAGSDRGDGPPNISVFVVSEAEQEPISNHASCDGKEWRRGSGETMEEFKRRVYDDLPVGGLPKMVVFWPQDEGVPRDGSVIFGEKCGVG